MGSNTRNFSANMTDKPRRRLNRPALFICDIQEKFRGPIWEYEKLILTTQKMLSTASILSIPVYATTQNRARLGETCSELDLSSAIEHVSYGLMDERILWALDGCLGGFV